jgi:hypothetical protein
MRKKVPRSRSQTPDARGKARGKNNQLTDSSDKGGKEVNAKVTARTLGKF